MMETTAAIVKKKILVFGNALVAEDSLPLKVLPSLRKKFNSIEFKEFDPTENIEEEGRELVILDSAIGIRKVTLIKDIEKIELNKSCTMHDFDLAITLKIMKKIGAIDSVKIIAVPIGYNERKAKLEVEEVVSKLFPEKRTKTPKTKKKRKMAK